MQTLIVQLNQQCNLRIPYNLLPSFINVCNMLIPVLLQYIQKFSKWLANQNFFLIIALLFK